MICRSISSSVPTDRLSLDRARCKIVPTGQRLRLEPRPDDLFALGFLARAATGDRRNTHESAIADVETVSVAFMGLTVGCAKCHNHFYDPIETAHFYAMKARLRSARAATR